MHDQLTAVTVTLRHMEYDNVTTKTHLAEALATIRTQSDEVAFLMRLIETLVPFAYPDQSVAAVLNAARAVVALEGGTP
jgi:hypothetical protein